MEFNKLVRDRIPEIIKKMGKNPITHIAVDEKEYVEALQRKLFEEAQEFIDQPSVEEAADVLEVLRAICVLENIDLSTLEEVRKNKEVKRGGFAERIILERTEDD